MRHWQAELIISAVAGYKRDYCWHHWQLIKVATLKKTEELWSPDISVSFHQAPTCFHHLIFPFKTTAPSLACLSCTLHHHLRGVRRGKWHHKYSPEVSWLITSMAACLVSGFPQGKLWSSPCLCTSRLFAKKGKRKRFNRMFFHLVKWQNSLLELCLSERILGMVSELAIESGMNYWVWTWCQNCSVVLCGIPERWDPGTTTEIFFIHLHHFLWIGQNFGVWSNWKIE